jgi:hypothetical protein
VCIEVKYCLGCLRRLQQQAGGFTLLSRRLAQVATGNCKGLLSTIVALEETDSEGVDRNVVFHCFGDDFVYNDI